MSEQNEKPSKSKKKRLLVLIVLAITGLLVYGTSSADAASHVTQENQHE